MSQIEVQFKRKNTQGVLECVTNHKCQNPNAWEEEAILLTKDSSSAYLLWASIIFLIQPTVFEELRSNFKQDNLTYIVMLFTNGNSYSILATTRHTWQHLVTSYNVLVTSGNMLVQLVTSWSLLVNFWSNSGN